MVVKTLRFQQNAVFQNHVALSSPSDGNPKVGPAFAIPRRSFEVLIGRLNRVPRAPRATPPTPFGSEPLQEKQLKSTDHAFENKYRTLDTLLTLSDTHSTLHAFIAAAIMRARDGAPRTGDTPFF